MPSACNSTSRLEDVGGAVEEGAGEHPGLDPPPRRVGFRRVTLPRFAESAARNVESMLGVIEQPPGECFDQRFLPCSESAGTG
jgi:hypothetical protein